MRQRAVDESLIDQFCHSRVLVEVEVYLQTGFFRRCTRHLGPMKSRLDQFRAIKEAQACRAVLVLFPDVVIPIPDLIARETRRAITTFRANGVICDSKAVCVFISHTPDEQVALSDEDTPTRYKASFAR